MKGIIVVISFLFSFFIWETNTNKYYASSPLDDGVFSYILSDTDLKAGIKVKEGTILTGKIVIPATIDIDGDSYTITEIIPAGFENQINITMVETPTSLLTISSNAFFGCSGLQEIAFYNGLQEIGNYAFYGCTELESISLPDSVKAIGDYAFAECQKLGLVTLPSEISKISDGLFSGCIALKNIVIPDEATTIGSYAFNRCLDIEEVILNQNISTIGIGAFAFCKKLTKIMLPATLKALLDGAFEGCLSLEEFNFPSSITNLGVSVLKDCIKLKEVTFDSVVNNIPNSTFMGCIALNEIYLPSNVTIINTSAFFGCVGLTNVVFLGLINKIENAAFSGCTNLEAIQFRNESQIPLTLGDNVLYGASKANFFFANNEAFDLIKNSEAFKAYTARCFIGLEFVYITSMTKQYATVDPIPEFLFTYFDKTSANKLITKIGREFGEDIGIYKYLPTSSILDSPYYKVLPNKTNSALTITKGTYDVVWPVFDSLYYGQSLIDINTIVEGSKSGTFIFDDNTSLDLGVNKRTLRFVHFDNNYLELTREYDIEVIQLFATFRDFSADNKVNILYGESLSKEDFPRVADKLGYYGRWEVDSIDNITDFIIIEAIYTLKCPAVSFSLDDKENFDIIYDGKTHYLTANITHELSESYLILWYIDDLLIESISESLALKDAHQAVYKIAVCAIDGNNISEKIIATVNVLINKYPITIMAHNEYIIAGASFDATFKVTSGQIFKGDFTSGHLHSDYISEPGEYLITIGTLSLGNNYQIEFINGILTVLDEINIGVIMITDSSIEFVPLTGVEYSIDGGKTYQSNNVFDNLEPNQVYKARARYIGLDNLGITELVDVKTKAQASYIFFISIFGFIILGEIMGIVAMIFLKKKKDKRN